MPSKSYCDKIANPKERAKCREYKGKYAKGKGKKAMTKGRGKKSTLRTATKKLFSGGY